MIKGGEIVSTNPVLFDQVEGALKKEFSNRAGENYHSINVEIEAAQESNDVEAEAVSRGGQQYRFDFIAIEDWDGKEAGKIVIAQNQTRLEKTLTKGRLMAMALSLIVTALALLFASLLMKKIIQPLYQMINTLKQISEGDFTKRVPLDTKDEIGELAQSINFLMETLQRMVQGISKSTATLFDSSKDLSSISNQLSISTQDMSSQSSNITTVAGNIAVNVSSFATATEQMSMITSDVAASAKIMEENMNKMTASVDGIKGAIEEIAENARSGFLVSEEATSLSRNAKESIHILMKTAQEIGAVSEVIKDIADQTNLLALNATIEACAAGEAGKGFVVVASEVKNLSSESTRAAQEISSSISGVHENTKKVETAMAEVSQSIERIKNAVDVISESAEKQRSTTNNISENTINTNSGISQITGSMIEVANGSDDISKRSEEVAMSVRNISEDIQSLDGNISKTSSSTQEINKAAKQLSEISKELKDYISQFKY